MQISERVDVVIVGAGPAGLTAACVLQAAGARILTVDAAEAGANTSRAAVIDARTLEVLDTIGVTGRLLADGVVVPVFTVRDQSKTLARLDFSSLPTRYPFTLMLPQSRTEEILAHWLAELGGHVKRRCTVTGVRMTRDGASVTVVGSNGQTRDVDARFVIGADGMHSVVRDVVGIGFEGGSYAQSFVLADVRLAWSSLPCPAGTTASPPLWTTPPKPRQPRTSRHCWVPAAPATRRWRKSPGVPDSGCSTASPLPTAKGRCSWSGTPHTCTVRLVVRA